MPKFHKRWSRAGIVVLTALATAGASTLVPASAQDSNITDASFTWGVSGYVQGSPMTADGVNVQFEDSTQTHYTPAAMPATAMPANTPSGQGAKALTFTHGTGTRAADGSVNISWTGSGTFKAAYSKVYSIANPTLTLDAAGAGQMTADVTVGTSAANGVISNGKLLGRFPIMTYSAGAAVDNGNDITLNPDYIGVQIDVEGRYTQVRECTGTTTDFGNGWWGSWPVDLVHAALAINANEYYLFYNRRCSEADSTKRQLPVQLVLNAQPTETTEPSTTSSSPAATTEPTTTEPSATEPSTPATAPSTTSEKPTAAQPEITLSETRLNADGSHQVRVTGKGFTGPAQTNGFYFGFGKFAENWRPSQGNKTAARPVTQKSVTWAVPENSYDSMAAAYPSLVAKLNADGTFEHTITIDKSEADALNSGAGNYGVYTYASHGASDAVIETYTPVTFYEATTSEETTPPATPSTATVATVETTTETATTTATATVTTTEKQPVTTTVATTVATTVDNSRTTTATVTSTATATTTATATATKTTTVAQPVTETVRIEVSKPASTTTASEDSSSNSSSSSFEWLLVAAGVFGIVAGIVSQLVRYLPAPVMDVLLRAFNLKR